MSSSSRERFPFFLGPFAAAGAAVFWVVVADAVADAAAAAALAGFDLVGCFVFEGAIIGEKNRLLEYDRIGSRNMQKAQKKQFCVKVEIYPQAELARLRPLSSGPW